MNLDYKQCQIAIKQQVFCGNPDYEVLDLLRERYNLFSETSEALMQLTFHVWPLIGPLEVVVKLRSLAWGTKDEAIYNIATVINKWNNLNRKEMMTTFPEFNDLGIAPSSWSVNTDEVLNCTMEIRNCLTKVSEDNKSPKYDILLKSFEALVCVLDLVSTVHDLDIKALFDGENVNGAELAKAMTVAFVLVSPRV